MVRLTAGATGLHAAAGPNAAVMASAGKRLSATATTYDAQGRVWKSTDAGGLASESEYYLNGQVHRTRQVTAAGVATPWTTYDYDLRDGLPAGTTHYDKVTDALGHTTKTYKDVLGRVVKTVFHDGSFTETAYSGAFGSVVKSYDQRKATDPAIYTERHYDVPGRLTDVYLPAVTDGDPASATYNTSVRPHWHYTYDKNGNQLTQADPKGNVTTFAYDEQNRRTSRTLPAVSGSTVTDTTEYDAFGRVEYSTDFKGNQATYRYDTLGRLEAEKWFDPGDNVATATPDVEYVTAYDNLGRTDTVTEKRAGSTVGVTDTDYDPITGAVVKVAGSNGTIQYAYDATTGRKARAWTNDNDTRYEYDGQGRLWHVTQKEFNGVASDLVTTYAYDAVGSLDWETLPNGVKEDYGYDDLNRLTSLVVTQADGDKLFEQAYVLEGDGQRDHVLEKRYDGTSATPFSITKVDWTYDALNRLTGETRDEGNDGIQNGGDYTDGYTFDLSNNRRMKSHDAVGTANDETITYTVDARDRLTSEDSTVNANDAAYGYDANGSTTSVTRNGATQKYVWDQRNNMTGFDANGDGDTADAGDATYTYNASGIRASTQVVGQAPAYYLLDSQNPTGYAKAVQQSATPGGSPTLSYILAARVVGQSDGTDMFTLVADGHGTTRALTTASGAVHQTYDLNAFYNKVRYADASNVPLAGAPLTVWLAPDGYRDFSTRLDRNGVRDVASWLGRMWSFDSYFGTAEDPQSLHKYLYSNSDPTNGSDPSGYMTLTFGVGSLFGDLLGGVGARVLAFGPYAAGVAAIGLGAYGAIQGFGGAAAVQGMVIDWISSGEAALANAASQLAARTQDVVKAINDAVDKVIAAGRATAQQLKSIKLFPVIRSYYPAVYALDTAGLAANPGWFLLTYNPLLANANRAAVWNAWGTLMSTAPAGSQLHEFPYAATAEGGIGPPPAPPAVAAPVPGTQNARHGAYFGAFTRWSLKGAPGTKFLVVPIPL